LATKKPKLPTLVSPIGIASFSHLAKPDTEGKFADGKYKVTLKLAKGVAENDAFAADMNKRHDDAGGEENYAPVKDGDVQNARRVKKKKEEKDEWKGMWLVTFKSQFPPQLLQLGTDEELDAANAPRSGDRVKVAFAAVPYESGENSGVSMQMRAVKLIERRARADYSDADWGDDEAEGGEQEASKAKEAPKGKAGGKDNDDF
jgi:hypothetical protein